MIAEPYLELAEPGQELPPLVKRPTTRQLVMYAGASGDFYQIHYDKDFAIAQGLPGVILHGALKSAFLGQLVTDWMGPEGELRSLSARYRDMDVPGDTLTCKGKVTTRDLGAGTVTCELWIENSQGKVTTTGEAVVALASRRGR
jgi:acyl dehydratase